MRLNVLKDRVQIQERVDTAIAMGSTTDWKPGQFRYARVVPLGVESRARYQQMNTRVTHRIMFNAVPAFTLSLGNHRITHGTKTYELVEGPETIENMVVVVVKEV